MTWTLVGYFPKRRTTRSDWMSPYKDHPNAMFPCSAPVEEICSVSDCISQGPGGWREQGKHNFYDRYDTPELAWSVVPAEVRAAFELFAYRLLLVQYEDGREEPMEAWWDLAVAPMSRSFARLGWDAVVGGNGHNFGCSPLSCISGADIVRCPELNRYCLVADERAATALARNFSITKPEAGPYCVLEVWRDTGTANPGAAPDAVCINAFRDS